jgi:hypothetical protein
MYAYKIEDQWSQNAIEHIEIRKLLMKGTLSPYDFVKAEDGVASMICKHSDFEGQAFEDWGKLRGIRTKLNTLWKGQLDAIMSGIVERVGPNQSIEPIGGETILSDIRSKIDDADIIELVDKFCRSKIEEGVLDNEIKRRTNGGAPYTIENLSFARDGGQLRDDKIVEKIDKIKEWINQQGLRNISRVCYVFKSAVEVLYVGKTENIVQRFFNEHFVSEIDGINGRRFFHECSAIEVYNVNGNIDGVYGLNNFESLMIYRHGTPENDNKPKYNRSAGVNLTRGPVYKLHHFISKEVDELKS